VDTEFDGEGSKVKHMGSLMGATAVKVHRSDGKDNPSQVEDSLPTSSLPSHLRNLATGEIRELRFRDGPNKPPPPEWFDQHPPLSKLSDIDSHTMAADIPKIKSRNEKVPLSVTLSSQKSVMKGLTAARKFDPGHSNSWRGENQGTQFFLGLYCNLTISLYFDISSYHTGMLI